MKLTIPRNDLAEICGCEHPTQVQIDSVIARTIDLIAKTDKVIVSANRSMQVALDHLEVAKFTKSTAEYDQHKSRGLLRNLECLRQGAVA